MMTTMFVATERVAVTEGENTIWIRPKMDLGTRNACLDALAALSEDGSNVRMHLGQYTTALMQHNILGWDGPAFEGMPCTPANIARLDPDEPLVERVLAELGQRNPMGGGASAAEKKGATSAGGRRSGGRG